MFTQGQGSPSRQACPPPRYGPRSPNPSEGQDGVEEGVGGALSLTEPSEGRIRRALADPGEAAQTLLTHVWNIFSLAARLRSDSGVS